MAFTKRALIRDPDAPIGQPAAMHIECRCGENVNVASNENACGCGAIYDERGYVIEASAASHTETSTRYN